MLPEFQLWWLMLLIPAVVGFCVRITPYWPPWRIAIAMTGSTAFAFSWLVTRQGLAVETAVLAVVGAAAVGASLPALLHAIESALRNPRTYVWAAGIIGGWWVVKHPLEAAIYFNEVGGALLKFLQAAGAEQIAILVLTIIIMWWGLKLIWRHVIRRRAS